MSETATPPAPGPAAPGPADTPVAGESVLRLPVAVLAVVATVVVALLAVAVVVRLDADRLPSGPPRDPPTEAAPPRMAVDGTAVTYKEFAVDMPAGPYRCADVQPSPVPSFTQIMSCAATVHDNYDGAGSDWAAVAGAAVVDDAVGAPGDLPGTARAVFDAIVELGYTRADKPEVTNRKTSAVAISVPPDAVATYSGRVEVQRQGLPTPYDQVVVVVVRLKDGERVAYFSDFPHDGSKQTLDALAKSVGTIRLRS